MILLKGYCYHLGGGGGGVGILRNGLVSCQNFRSYGWNIYLDPEVLVNR